MVSIRTSRIALLSLLASLLLCVSSYLPFFVSLPSIKRSSPTLHLKGSLSNEAESNQIDEVPQCAVTLKDKADEAYQLLDLAEIANCCDLPPNKMRSFLSTGNKRKIIRIVQRNLMDNTLRYNIIEYIDTKTKQRR